MTDKKSSLDKLRNEIDTIDDKIHDLIMKRTELVGDIAAAKGIKLTVNADDEAQATHPGQIRKPNLPIALRPGREATILRRLIARHNGVFPADVLVRLWREVFGALVGLQGHFNMAVFMPGRGAGFLEIARDHFGAYTAFHVCASVGQVIKEVGEGNVSVGVIPTEDEYKSPQETAPWWLRLVSAQESQPRIVTRLPFNGPGQGRGDGQEAYVLACIEHDQTGDDCTLTVFETDDAMSISGLKAELDKACIPVNRVMASYEITTNMWAYLVESYEYIGQNDARIAKLLDTRKEKFIRATVIGGYAIPPKMKQ